MLGLVGFLLVPDARALTTRRARIIVSLADNANQGIVPIKSSLGNGQNPSQNLYWGALYGMKSYFRRTEKWTLKPEIYGNPNILDAFMMTHSNHADAVITVEAWDGAKQVDALKAYLQDLRDNQSKYDFVCFVGHNVLMDVELTEFEMLRETQTLNLTRDRKAAVIACNSAPYFKEFHEGLGVESYVMTRGLMAPEAYVMDGILKAWLGKQGANTAKLLAAEKYAEYQKISISAASRLFGAKR